MAKRKSGFTLIEMLIVVVIISILAALAIPSYSKYVQRARRSDAIIFLERVAALQERYYFQNNTYATTAQLGVGNSPEGYYTIAVDALTNIDGSTGYTLIAVPAAAGPQASDVECSSFRIDAQGVKDIGASGAAFTVDNVGCWHR